MTKPRPTLEDHFEMANLVYDIQDANLKLMEKLQKHYPLNYNVNKEIKKIEASIFAIKNLLDNDYCETITEDELEKYNFIYYNGKAPREMEEE